MGGQTFSNAMIYGASSNNGCTPRPYAFIRSYSRLSGQTSLELNKELIMTDVILVRGEVFYVSNVLDIKINELGL